MLGIFNNKRYSLVDAFSAMRARIFWAVCLTAALPLVSSASSDLPQPVACVKTIHLNLSDLRSAYLVRAGEVHYDATANTPEGAKAQLQRHFDTVIGLLLVTTERSIDTALARLEAADDHSWTDAERAEWKKQLLSSRYLQLQRLGFYRDRGQFPQNEGQSAEPVPIFVDKHDTACAVGQLMRWSGWSNQVADIHAGNNLIYVPDAAKSAVAEWALTSGLTLEEAALIQPPYGGGFGRNPGVGGVSIDANGVVSNPQQGQLKELQTTWQKGLQPVPEDLNKWTDLRFLSLKQLEAELANARAMNKPIPDAVRYVAGLQRVKYVLVYPEQHDVVLAGPAEGWKIDARGSVVGATSNRPVLTLDDLMVAMRVAESANTSGISCSIDPTPEGLQRMREITGQLSAKNGPQMAAKQMEDAVGQQKITVTGIPATSHFARTIVAADFRMKRLAMNFEPAPVDGLPSFLTLLKGRQANSMMPRWWMAPNYEPLQRDADGLAWEIKGQGVKCMTEQEFLNSSGQKERSAKVEPAAQKWADTFTDKFDDLAREDSSFGQLRNVMDLAVVGALLVKERLAERCGFEAPNLMNDQPLEEYPAPRNVASQASFVKAGHNWVISVSGGIQIFPWQVADRTEVSKNLALTRSDQPASKSWYWQR